MRVEGGHGAARCGLGGVALPLSALCVGLVGLETYKEVTVHRTCAGDATRAERRAESRARRDRGSVPCSSDGRVSVERECTGCVCLGGRRDESVKRIILKMKASRVHVGVHAVHGPWGPEPGRTPGRGWRAAEPEARECTLQYSLVARWTVELAHLPCSAYSSS